MSNQNMAFSLFWMFFSPSGLKESSRMSHSDSALLAEIMDECRRQVGVVYNQDHQ